MSEVRWWLCPNDPPCEHAGVVHDIEDFDDDTPRCCLPDCDCGVRAAPPEGGNR